jgi:hypothetical protein
MNERPFNDTSYEQFLAEWKLMGSKCKKCGVRALPPRPICVSCYGADMEWVEFKGTGRLSAFTSIMVAPPNLAKEGYGRNNPYVVGVVELDEGAKAVARIVGVDAQKPEEIKVGTAMRAEFVTKEEGGARKTSLVFRPR